MTQHRCRWCGCFVAANTEPTTRTVHGSRDGVLAWRTFTQSLCPRCAGSWCTDLPWNRAATPAEAAHAEVFV